MEEQQNLTTGNYKEKTDTEESLGYLAPDQLPQPKKNTPHPLLQVQRLTAERLPSKLHDHNLHRRKHKPINSIPPSLLRMNSIFKKPAFTCTAKVPKTIEQKMGFLKMPSKTFLSPWIFLAFISLKSCIMTKVLNMMV